MSRRNVMGPIPAAVKNMRMVGCWLGVEILWVSIECKAIIDDWSSRGIVCGDRCIIQPLIRARCGFTYSRGMGRGLRHGVIRHCPSISSIDDD
jgi:hypothetical protein